MVNLYIFVGDNIHLFMPILMFFDLHIFSITTESFLKTSAFLYIVVSMNGQNLGSRQVKCERNMDTLSLILANSKNPIDLMCQVSILQVREQYGVCEE